MSASAYQGSILATIDQLRKRKARPDVHRICNLIHKRMGLNYPEVESHLERLVDEGSVIKVEYKGKTSYRNAAKWCNNKLGGQILNSKESSYKLIQAVRRITSTHQLGKGGNYASPPVSLGATKKEIEKWLINERGEELLLHENLQTALEREINAGSIVETQNGYYCLSSTDEAPTCETTTQCLGFETEGKRTPSFQKRGKNKRRKLQYQQGDEAYTFRPINSSERCDFCLQTSDFNKRGEKENLLKCRDCRAKAHPSCMEYSDELARVAYSSPWQCIDCKTCFLCEDADDPDAMLFCDACDKGYHMTCHNPEIKDKPTGKWACSTCLREGRGRDFLLPLKVSLVGGRISSITPRHEDDVQEGGGPSCLPTPTHSLIDGILSNSQTTPHKEQLVNGKPKVNKVQTEDMPHWTVTDVVNYISSTGFPVQADGFREQEIDGTSLLLLRRNDVLSGLNLKLGPALKIYKLVKHIQESTVDTKQQ